jgi:hypothetical protein
MRVAFARPLLSADGGIDMQRLVIIEAAVRTQPGFAQAKQAAEVMIKVAKQLVAPQPAGV